MNKTSNPLEKPEFPRSAKYDPDWVMDMYDPALGVKVGVDK